MLNGQLFRPFLQFNSIQFINSVNLISCCYLYRLIFLGTTKNLLSMFSKVSEDTKKMTQKLHKPSGLGTKVSLSFLYHVNPESTWVKSSSQKNDAR